MNEHEEIIDTLMDELGDILNTYEDILDEDTKIKGIIEMSRKSVFFFLSQEALQRAVIELMSLKKEVKGYLNLYP
jgi:hypothetical protein